MTKISKELQECISRLTKEFQLSVIDELLECTDASDDHDLSELGIEASNTLESIVGHTSRLIQISERAARHFEGIAKLNNFEGVNLKQGQ